MDEKINQIVKKYKYDKAITGFADEYYKNDTNFYRNIRSKNDVEVAYKGIANILEDYEKNNQPLVEYDIEQMERLLGKFEVAAHKVLTCIEDTKLFDYTAEELKQLIDCINTFNEKASKMRIIIWNS